MTKDELIVVVASILSTLRGTDGSPATSLYMALGSDMDKWLFVSGLMARGGLITMTSEWVKLTPKGEELAAKVDAAVGIN